MKFTIFLQFFCFVSDLKWEKYCSGLDHNNFLGPSDVPRVSQYRLAAHLSSAVVLYSALFWSAKVSFIISRELKYECFLVKAYSIFNLCLKRTHVVGGNFIISFMFQTLTFGRLFSRHVLFLLLFGWKCLIDLKISLNKYLIDIWCIDWYLLVDLKSWIKQPTDRYL